MHVDIMLTVNEPIYYLANAERDHKPFLEAQADLTYIALQDQLMVSVYTSRKGI